MPQLCNDLIGIDEKFCINTIPNLFTQSDAMQPIPNGTTRSLVTSLCPRSPSHMLNFMNFAQNSLPKLYYIILSPAFRKIAVGIFNSFIPSITICQLSINPVDILPHSQGSFTVSKRIPFLYP